MSVIFCPINMFDKYQIIYKINSNTQEIVCKTDLSNIDENLVNACYAKDVYKIHVLGIQDIASIIADRVKKYEFIKYSNNKIEIEVSKNETFD